MAKKIIRLTESDLTRLVQRVIEEQSTGQYGNYRDPQRISFFNNLANQIFSKIKGKKLFFGNIGVLKDDSILIQQYVDRNHAINEQHSPVKEFNLYFCVRRTEEDLYPNEKFGARPWYGLLLVTGNYTNGKLASSPVVKLFGGGCKNTDFNLEMEPKGTWTWDMVGGSDLWSKAANPPN